MADDKTLTALHLSAATREKMNRIKVERRLSFTDQITEAIDRLYVDLFPDPAETAIVIGYLRIDRPGDIDPDEMTCAECGQDIRLERGAFIAVLKSSEDVTLGNAPLCGTCASSD